MQKLLIRPSSAAHTWLCSQVMSGYSSTAVSFERAAISPISSSLTTPRSLSSTYLGKSDLPFPMKNGELEPSRTPRLRASEQQDACQSQHEPEGQREADPVHELEREEGVARGS